MQNNIKISFTIFFLIFIVGCENKKDNSVNISAVSSGIKIENYTNASIGYISIQEEFLPLVDWCISCTESNQVAINKSVIVDSTQILGYEKGKMIVIYYWNCPYESGDGLEIEKVKAK